MSLYPLKLFFSQRFCTFTYNTSTKSSFSAAGSIGIANFKMDSKLSLLLEYIEFSKLKSFQKIVVLLLKIFRTSHHFTSENASTVRDKTHSFNFWSKYLYRMILVYWEKLQLDQTYFVFYTLAYDSLWIFQFWDLSQLLHSMRIHFILWY